MRGVPTGDDTCARGQALGLIPGWGSAPRARMGQKLRWR